MATNKRNYPNDYYAWYNDDSRIAIVEQRTDLESNTHNDEYDSFQGDGDLSGNITATSDGAGSTVTITSNGHGLAIGDRVKIVGTTSYDGNHEITNVGDANTFRITATNSESNEGASSGVTWTSLFVSDALRFVYHSKYTDVTAQSNDLYTNAGLDSGMHQYVLCYVKSRLLEDIGDLERAQYFRTMFEVGIKQYPMRKSAVRKLSVPKL